MDDAINRRRVGRRRAASGRLPHVQFLGPVGEGATRRPATFTHDEVMTLFHEFGHGLHQLLTRSRRRRASRGSQGVEWDAVELPSQFMENFCWEWDVVAPMTAHVDTGALAAASARSSTEVSRGQDVRERHGGWSAASSSPRDMHVHSISTPGPALALRPSMDAAGREVAVTPRLTYDRFMQSFLHVFAGGYAAGFYSYQVGGGPFSGRLQPLSRSEGVPSPATGA